MSCIYNSNILNSIKYNGIEIDTLKFNGTTIWERINWLRTGVSLIGNCTNIDGVLSNFSSNSLAQGYDAGTDIPNKTAFIIVLKFNTTYTTGVDQCLFCVSQSSQFSTNPSTYIRISGTDKIYFGKAYGNGTQSFYGTYNFVDNTNYWIKIEVFNDKSGTINLSTDGTTYTQLNTFGPGSSYNYNFPSANKSFILGVYQDEWLGNFTQPFSGTIDLKGCYILIDGEYWWKGA